MSEPVHIDPAFGHWLAGLIDGEGCFRVHMGKGGTYYAAHFSLKLRDDDQDVLASIAERTGIGRIYFDAHRSGNSKPCASWTVQSMADALVLVGLVERFPLHTRKARDFEVWARAVRTWATMKRGNRWAGPRDWTPMIDLKQELEAARAYRAPEEVMP